MGLDWYYLVLVVPAMILSIAASYMVKSRFATYDKIKSKKNISGAMAAKILMQANEIDDVQITHISGSLTDNYNSTDKTLNLSDSTYSSTSIAAVGVAAHETGHAIQDKTKYAPLGLRHSLYPVANIGSRFGPTLAILGILFGASANVSNSSFAAIASIITKVGIILYIAAVLFYVVTLPVEFNASSRALKILKETGTLDSEELSGVKKILWAAAMTYVASALTAIGSLIRLILISKRNRR
ncbi:MAG: zinc metallopeptidase [Treponema sp.]|nr:zinc metallopeptidase [Treponema sp.]